jgi:hypothetical protein
LLLVAVVAVIGPIAITVVQVAEVAAGAAVASVQAVAILQPEVQLQIRRKEMLVGLVTVVGLVAVVEQDLQEAALLDQLLGLAGLV